jgi:BioD-like phosphotransacetylase family protein
MNADELAQKLNARVLTGDAGAGREVTGVYACDLLSRVMSRAKKGDAWITVHTHINIVAVALLAELSCIILPENIELEEQTLKKAAEEGIPILSTALDCYGICCAARECLGPDRGGRA